VASILKFLRMGNYRVVAAEASGVSDRTFLRWMEQGEAEPEGPFGAFVEKVMAAERAAEVYHVQQVHKHALDDWRASIEFLARKHPDRWAKREYSQTDLNVRGDLTLRFEHVPTEELASIANGNHGSPSDSSAG